MSFNVSRPHQINTAQSRACPAHGFHANWLMTAGGTVSTTRVVSAWIAGSREGCTPLHSPVAVSKFTIAADRLSLRKTIGDEIDRLAETPFSPLLFRSLTISRGMSSRWWIRVLRILAQLGMSPQPDRCLSAAYHRTEIVAFRPAIETAIYHVQLIE